jgi:zinc protease
LTRQLPPPVGEPTAVRFPRIERETLDNGLHVWVIEEHCVPAVTVALVVDAGTSADPPALPGLAGVALDLLDEGAGGRNAIELADAFGDLGCELGSDVGPDVASLGFTAITRVLPAALDLLGDVVQRPAHLEPDFRRVVELRKHNLQQRSRSAGSVADRALLAAVFGTHPYAHGALGTSAALDRMGLDRARTFWARRYAPQSATLVVSGDVDPPRVIDMVRASFGGWTNPSYEPPAPAAPPPPMVAGVHFVDRPGAAQSELRVGHTGPPRTVPGYHGLLVLDALLGGQFSSRINRNLREARGLTYGARTSFGFRRFAGNFTCDASVQSDRTAEAASEVIREFEAIRAAPVSDEELARAKAALSRGYVRHFETASQYVRAAMQLVTFGLDDRTFDRFVPAVESVSAADVLALAKEYIRPDEAAIVVVGDSRHCRAGLDGLGRPVIEAAPEF